MERKDTEPERTHSFIVRVDSYHILTVVTYDAAVVTHLTGKVTRRSLIAFFQDPRVLVVGRDMAALSRRLKAHNHVDLNELEVNGMKRDLGLLDVGYPEDCHGTLNFAYSWQNYIFAVVDSRTTNAYGFTISNVENKVFDIPTVPNIYLLVSGDVNSYKDAMKYLHQHVNVARLFGVVINVNWVCHTLCLCRTEKSAGFIVVGWNPGSTEALIRKVTCGQANIQGLNPVKAGSAAELMGDFQLSTGVDHQIATVLNEVFTFCLPAAILDPHAGGLIKGFVVGKDTGMDMWYTSMVH